MLQNFFFLDNSSVQMREYSRWTCDNCSLVNLSMAQICPLTSRVRPILFPCLSLSPQQLHFSKFIIHEEWGFKILLLNKLLTFRVCNLIRRLNLSLVKAWDFSINFLDRVSFCWQNGRDTEADLFGNWNKCSDIILQLCHKDFGKGNR